MKNSLIKMENQKKYLENKKNSKFFFLSELSKSIEFLIKFNFKFLRNLMNFKSLKQANSLIKLVGHVAWAR